MMVCAFLFFLDVLINVDHGALPSAAVAIKEELDMPNVALGTLGSLVFLGLVTGSLCAAYVMATFKFKTILSVSFLGNGVGLLLFIAKDSFYSMCLSRFISGFFQIFMTIYIPLYVDCFGSRRSKPIMFSLILLAAPLGIVIGYGCTGVLIGNGISWRYSFLFQGATMAFSAIIVLFVPGRLINIFDCQALKKAEKNR
jgi:MFS family permease